MTFQHFKLDVDDDGIALVTWDSPGRSMNVIDLKVMEELSAIVERVASDAAIKGAVVTSGKETFSAGADLTLLESLVRGFTELAKSKGPEAAATTLFEESRKLSLLYRRLETSGKPWAAAINGTAFGGGFELALACDVILASDRSVFALPEARLGLVPGAGGAFRLARQLPQKIAMGYLLTGRWIDAATALWFGLVNEVVAADRLDDCVQEWVNDVLESAPLSVRAIKEAVLRSIDMPLEQAFSTTYTWEQRRCVSRDAAEGVRAFAEKRSPVWTGR